MPDSWTWPAPRSPADVRIDDAQKSLRMEYRSKLLNPKWYEDVLASGQGGRPRSATR